MSEAAARVPSTPVRAVRPWEWARPPRPARLELVHAPPRAPVAKAPPLLFVPGLAHAAWCFTEHWLPYAASRGFDGYAMSLRGYGGSDGRRLGTRLRDYVDDVVRTASDLPRRPVLVGHSMGGLVVQRALERYTPAAVVLVAPAPPRHGLTTYGWVLLRQPFGALAALAGASLRFRPRLLVHELDRARAVELARRQERCAPLTQYQLVLPRRAPRPTVVPPLLLVGAARDRVIPRSDIRATARFWRVQPRWYDGIGHDMMLDAGWRRPIDDILDWVAALPAR
jgi:pimeloyl-ACP methyl ester carboxylesterase